MRDVVSAFAPGPRRREVDRFAREVREAGRRLAACTFGEGRAAFAKEGGLIPNGCGDRVIDQINHQIRKQLIARIDVEQVTTFQV